MPVDKRVRQEMTRWSCALFLLCCFLSCVESSVPFSSISRTKYSNSFRLASLTRTRVQQLLMKYKEQQLGNRHFEDRGGQLKGLPSSSTDFYSWLKLTDQDRLQAAFSDMQVYRTWLEWKRQQLEKEAKDQMTTQKTHSALLRSIKHIQLDLRDLMKQVSSKLSYMKNSQVKPTSPTVMTPLMQVNTSKTEWESRVEVYIILRDLNLYLTKLARDFLLLESKTQL